MGFVIDNLGPSDRLSVISFSDDARRLFPLLLMTGSGKQHALQAVNSLVVEGLKIGTKVLEDRKHKNLGTFSFIEAEGLIQDAFAQCIGGLLSVVVQELQVHIQSLDPHLCLSQLKAGSYSTNLTNDNQTGSVDIGDLYADEERDFLVLVNIPVLANGNSNDQMKLVSVYCSYKDPFTKESVTTEAIEVKLQRPEMASEDMVVSIGVDRQKNRLQVAEALNNSRAAAERETASMQAGDKFSHDLDLELQEVRSRMKNKKVYESTGRGFLLSGMSSHSRQLATARGGSTKSLGFTKAYQTPSMSKMVLLSRQSLRDLPPPDSSHQQ
ncbi:hypothetical protein MKW92_009310 [Papaver armeniacum]|nr:hypothetical protein MKW92_009310 [Papaver armeniacum]